MRQWYYVDKYRALGYVGYDPTLQTVVVSHQGTDPFELYASSKCTKTFGC